MIVDLRCNTATAIVMIGTNSSASTTALGDDDEDDDAAVIAISYVIIITGDRRRPMQKVPHFAIMCRPHHRTLYSTGSNLCCSSYLIVWNELKIETY